jgi:DNA-binding response OmpR family regulator
MAERILVVDDERSITMMLRMILEAEGWTVETASSAGEALRVLRASEFDIVITDMRMETPVSGMEVAGFAKASKARPAVVILSAFPLQTSDWVGRADAYLQKGGSVHEMIAVVTELLRARAA